LAAMWRACPQRIIIVGCGGNVIGQNEVEELREENRWLRQLVTKLSKFAPV